MTAGRTNSNPLSHNWCTPKKYVSLVHDFFNGPPSLDPCSNEWSLVEAKVEYKLPLNDGLEESWEHPTIFVNPPYGKDRDRGTSIKDWVRRCSDAYLSYGSEVLALVPVATNTSHWKNYVFKYAIAISFLGDTRLKFMIDGVEGG